MGKGMQRIMAVNTSQLRSRLLSNKLLRRNTSTHRVSPFCQTKWISLLAVLFFVVLPLCTGCHPEKAVVADAPPTHLAPLVRTYDQEFVHCRQTVEPTTINAAGQLKVTLDMQTKEGYALTFPSDSQSFGDFVPVSIRKGEVVFAGNGLVSQTVEYTLEPPGPGSFQIPALTISSWEKAKDEAEAVELATEAMPITVSSLFADPKRQPELHDILPPVSQPFSKLVVAGAAVALLLLLALIVWLIKRKRKPEPGPPQLPAHIRAGKALDRLLAEQLLAKGEVKLFYQRVSDILRSYIEERFGVKAPERTTEEFLAEIGGKTLTAQPGLVAHKLLISKFLTHCDLVKFAKHQPSSDETDMAVAICREFIHATRPSEFKEQAAGQAPPPISRNISGQTS